MFCIKCGEEAFPVRIACTACDATLPDIPAIFELPGQRTKRKDVRCERCGAVARDARIACMHCDATLPRPFSLTVRGGELPDDQRVAYWEFLCDDDACDECRKFKGFCFLPSRRSDFRVPIPVCTFPVCWCGMVAIFKGRWTLEGDDSEIVKLLQQSDGTATGEQVSAYLLRRRPPAPVRSAREKAGVDLYMRAFEAGKGSVEEAIPLYREALPTWKAAVAENRECEWDWGYLRSTYSQLIVALEKSGQPARAIEAIDEYRSFMESMGRKEEASAFSRRKSRLRRRVEGKGPPLDRN